MKNIMTSCLAALLLAAVSAFAEDGPLPFAVTVGSQSATYTQGQAFAQVAKPVAADAALSIDSKAEMSIINVHKVGADGQPDPAVQPAVILLQGTSKGTLAQTMDQRKLAPGKYFLSITSGDKTASIQFEVQ
jgi:ABC-type sugar transport system substrate-binding protein